MYNLLLHFTSLSLKLKEKGFSLINMHELLKLIEKLSKTIARKLNIMEVCGTHTAEIFKHGIRDILPESITLLSGPGCPVCVTSINDIDKTIEISRQDDIILTTFGDMMRVPGSRLSLSDARAEGANIIVVYSPMISLDIARLNQNKKIVFLSTGFETTIPLIAATIEEAEQSRIDNFHIYPLNKLLPPALNFLLDSKEIAIDGFILPGHVSTIIGSDIYEFISSKYSIPSVITGFTADDILTGIAMLLRQIYEERSDIEIQYSSVVKKQGNKKALSLIYKYFEPDLAYWRGIGLIERSGLSLGQGFKHRDINSIFNIYEMDLDEAPKGCMCGYVLKGIMTPPECSLFGQKCTPSKPMGACMVSDEGNCAIYYKYRSANFLKK